MMSLISKGIVKEILKKYNIYPSRRLGQNFLVDEGVLKKIIEAANLTKSDVVLEVGPGIGNLTLELAKKVHPVKSSQSEVFAGDEQFNRVKNVIAVEKDKRMCQILKELLEGWNVRNVEIVNKDILKLEPKTYHLKPKTYKIVANIPYYLTSPLIRKFLEAKNPPEEMILMVQKEVAQRICAKPPKMSILAVSVQFYAKPEIISFVSKKSFWPSPKVDSAIIKISALNQRRKSAFNQRFFKIVKAGFSQPRKQLINNLSRLNFSSRNLSGQAKNPKLNREKVKNWLLKNEIEPSQRAETLTVKDWLKLTKAIK